MKTTYIVRAKNSRVRVPEQFISFRHNPHLYAHENDFTVVQFPTIKAERETMKAIARKIGQAFYEDNETGATYLKLEDNGYDPEYWTFFALHYLQADK